MSGQGPAAGPDGSGAGRGRWSDLRPRIVSAAVLIAAAVVAVYFGGLVFALLVAVVFAGAYREWEMMIAGGEIDRPGLVLTGLVALSALAHALMGIAAAAIVIVLACGLALAVSDGSRRGWRLPGLLFAGAVVAALLQLRGIGAEGIWACVFLAAVIWGTDTGAFFAGRLIGGVRLWPSVSPGKTWSGAVGGLVAGSLGGLLVWTLVTASPWWIGLLLAAAASVVGQLGDLGESALKRRFRVKDSGDLIPGHGGLMDRLDSLAPAALFLALVGLLNAGFGSVASGVLNW